MKVFVTGAAGFIASRLSLALLERGDSVVGLDNFSPYYARELKEKHISELTPQSRFTLVEGDLRDAGLLRGLFERERFDAVAHIGAMAAVRYSVLHPLIYGEVNLQGSLNVLDAARSFGSPPCVLASTGSVYGSDTPVPFSEEVRAARPLAPYPASKRSMEIFAHSYAHTYGLPVSVLRFFNVYGPHGRPDMMPWHWSQQIAAGETITLYNDGDLKRDWTYIDDIVRGFILALDAKLGYEIINLGGGSPVVNLRLVHILESLVGRSALINSVPAPLSEPLETFADIRKAQRMLGWNPTVRIEEGLEEFVEWMRAEGHLPERCEAA